KDFRAAADARGALDHDARVQHGVGLERGVGVDADGFGEDHGHALLHPPPAETCLKDAVGLGEFRPRVDAADLVLVLGLDRRHAFPIGDQSFDQVGQVIFAFDDALLNFPKRIQDVFEPGEIDAGVHFSDFALPVLRLFFLDDAGDVAVRPADDATV